MIKAVGYVRVSKDEQADRNLSIPAQKASILSYCKSQNWNLVEIFVDDGYSGENLNRPDIQKLLKQCPRNKFDAVVVWKLDRISRKQKDVLFLLEDVFEPNKIGFKSVTQAFDTTSAFGKAALGMLAVFAQLEREQLIERILAAKKQSAIQGRFMGGKPPYGYIYDTAKKDLVINEQESHVVRQIFSEYLRGGRGYQALADWLNDLKIPTYTSAQWCRTTISKILTNPVYIGLISHRGSLHAGKHKAIIEPQIWQDTQSLIKTRNKYTPQIHAGLVSGIIYCGECGAKMRTKHVWQNHPKIPKKISRYYICYSQDKSASYMTRADTCNCGYKNSDIIDEYVKNKIVALGANQESARKAVMGLLKDTSSDEILKLLNQAKKEIAQIQKKLNKWYEAFEKDTISIDDLSERVRDLRERKSILEEQVAEFESQIDNENARLKSVGNIVSMLRDFSFLWEAANEEERKFLVRNLLSKVIVHKDNDVDVEFSFKI